MSYTPGPWTIETVTTSCGLCHKIGPFPPKHGENKPRHACLYADYPSADDPSDAELLANARLIAAAPELLEAAKHAIAWFESAGYQVPASAQLYAAIAKATEEAK